MERLPIAISLAHCGTRVPVEVADLCALSAPEIARSGDLGLAELCGPLIDSVEVFATTAIARAIVDLDCGPDDRSPDGVVKTRTPWSTPVYRSALPPGVVEALVARYYRPFHRELALRAGRAMIGLDWHVQPPNGSEFPKGGPRRLIELHSSQQVPRPWVRALASAFEATLGVEPTILWRDVPGHIARSAPGAIPWIRVALRSSEPDSIDSATLRRTLAKFSWRIQQRRGKCDDE